MTFAQFDQYMRSKKEGGDLVIAALFVFNICVQPLAEFVRDVLRHRVAAETFGAAFAAIA